MALVKPAIDAGFAWRSEEWRNGEEISSGGMILILLLFDFCALALYNLLVFVRGLTLSLLFAGIVTTFTNGGHRKGRDDTRGEVVTDGTGSEVVTDDTGSEVVTDDTRDEVVNDDMRDEIVTDDMDYKILKDGITDQYWRPEVVR